MRFADTLFRRGHLSEDALAEVWMTGERPRHLDQCAICAERATQMSQWLEDVRDVGVAVADAAFPAERLAMQQAQILRRLEQLDHPARVIAFPGLIRSGHAGGVRAIRPAWLAVAAAAGLVLGVAGGQMMTRLGPTPPSVAAQPPAVSIPATHSTQTASIDPQHRSELLQTDQEDRPRSPFLEVLDDLTPRYENPSVQLVSTNRPGGI